MSYWEWAKLIGAAPQIAVGDDFLNLAVDGLEDRQSMDVSFFNDIRRAASAGRSSSKIIGDKFVRTLSVPDILFGGSDNNQIAARVKST
ncbi:hypothetical protein [Bradyrhizobium sp. JYMT SZCCT0428]|uniref:hypothetical protein n=1 Tax=Bradyrhizobium sp. JYMT SZCCT0428 TaxID=2807673 RepID=UPI001BA581A7|nr:hypothetical protein [Bradyrhizobium sp. JYMT SZCCT0428]MBR1155035.1 hypothetical protein [Bradyrhizobium sp. JYMT SZCCT0428]